MKHRYRWLTRLLIFLALTGCASSNFAFCGCFGQEYEAEIDSEVEKHDYDMNPFQLQENRMTYVGDGSFTYRRGLDVCHCHGTID